MPPPHTVHLREAAASHSPAALRLPRIASCLRGGVGLVGLVTGAMLLIGSTIGPSIRSTMAEDAGEAADATETKGGWSRLENADATGEYKERVKEAASLDPASREFLLKEALPQLARSENRGSIERVRRRIRELLITDIANRQVVDEVNGVVADFMGALARDAAADPVVRVNAVLMIGELRTVGNKAAWADAAPRLAALAKDPTIDAGVRVAAVAGLSRSGVAEAATPQAAGAAGQALMAILAEPIDGGGPEREWLAGRVATMLPVFVTEYPKPVVDRLAALLADASRGNDLRVRTAAALGARVTAKSAVDAGQVVGAVEALAVRILADDVEKVERKQFEQQYRQQVGGAAEAAAGWVNPAAPMGGIAEGQGGPTAIAEEVVRREAWRLLMLAGALDGGDGGLLKGSSGIAGAAQGPVADKAKSLASTLRAAALELDANPTEQALMASLGKLRPQGDAKPGDAAAPEGEAAPEAPAQRQPADEAPQPSPFGASPFG